MKIYKQYLRLSKRLLNSLMYVYEHNNLALQKILSLSGFSCWCLEQLPVLEKQHGAVEQLDVEEQLAAAPWKLPGAAPISLGRVGSPTNSTSKEKQRIGVPLQ